MFESVQATPSNGFTGTIHLSFSGLPLGVTGVPSGPYSLIISGGAQSLAVQLLAAQSTGTGDSVKSRTAYQNFFALWKDADPDIPILKEAKAEYAKLQ
jgi:hypothetical protein